MSPRFYSLEEIDNTPRKTRGSPPIPIKIRFLDKINKDGPDQGSLGKCWLWTGQQTHSKYGQINSRFTRILAHRLSWMIYRGPIPEHLDVLHECDVKICVNPDHLKLGTDQENANDVGNHGKRVNGERICTAKLTTEKVLEMRHKFANGVSQKLLRREYGLTNGQVSKIVRGLAWKHVGGIVAKKDNEPG